MSNSNEIPNSHESNGGSEVYHTPILLNETIEGLSIKPASVYVDCTFGGGGHSRAILEKLDDESRLIVFDQDSNAKQNVPSDKRVLFIPQNFRHLQRFLRVNKITVVDGILADLGVSSHQFNEAERGFSTRFDANLDMRMDERQDITAAHILKTFSELQLHKMFEKYGEVTNARTLAKTIVEQRAVAPINTIAQFKEAIKNLIKGNPNKYLAQVFQALRIEVNDEMGALKDMLEQSVNVLKSGGRIAIITFHSLEDRMVKNFFKQGSFEEKEDDMFGRREPSSLMLVNKKPITASVEELKRNPRSRSAKLRIAEKI